MSSVKDLAGVKLPSTPKGDSVEYVLDGQQRLASLFVTIEGCSVQSATSKKIIDYKNFYINLERDPDVYYESIVTDKKPKEKSVRIYDLLNETMNWFVSNSLTDHVFHLSEGTHERSQTSFQASHWSSKALKELEKTLIDNANVGACSPVMITYEGFFKKKKKYTSTYKLCNIKYW